MRAVLLFLFQFFMIFSFAQRQAAVWYFGENAGLDFSQELPQPLLNGRLNSVAGEGSAVISDDNGNLLFYSDGVMVYNQFHNIMSNGSNLWGHYSTTQTLIVPQPCNDSIFFVFTISPQYDAVFADDSVGCHYSIVDVNGDNGEGTIFSKNVTLFKKATEKVTGVRHANGTDVWVVFHEWETNCFRSYLITTDGINLQPVLSCVGSVHVGGGPSSNSNAAGQMKISPNGEFLALALTAARSVEVFSFDSNTGRVTNLIESISIHNNNRIGVYYGIEFSPSSKQLYFTYGYWSTGCGVNIAEDPSEVWQYGVENQKLTKVGSFVGTLNAMQLALDGKIYISVCNDITGESDYMAVINNPGREGKACNFQTRAVSLQGRKNKLGLPNFIQSYFRFEDPVIDMPNVFTPNGDEYNPIFKPIRFENMLEADLQIINRWGQQVFYTNDVNSGWSGGNAPAGVYYWLLRFEGKNGKIGTAKGWVHLFR
ncbi:MAG TPA: gliding motility-associated C-terminal domain-containing protein [Cyclobacteriaceae bacterium]|nr:gliding motility-associated C-terminal domain-containing protein [Cyclobacteriaceae bacterium]HRJ80718.1 gliding motility-associated C-terminal domain-containing protein [Cyclobacteriaceae bacterium]